jgi:hypothetical protein
METQQRSREVCYTVNVPEQRTRCYNVTVYDDIIEQVAENYSVCVPVQSTRCVNVRVCRQVPVQIQVPVCCYGDAAVSTGVIHGGEVISDGAVIETGAGCTNCN